MFIQEELEVSYEIKKYERTQQRRAPKELYDVHPLGKSPVIVDGDLTIAESGAIVGECSKCVRGHVVSRIYWTTHN